MISWDRPYHAVLGPPFFTAIIDVEDLVVVHGDYRYEPTESGSAKDV